MMMIIRVMIISPSINRYNYLYYTLITKLHTPIVLFLLLLLMLLLCYYAPTQQTF